ncbi:MAG: TolC family protein, partial [Tannerellaceae bacterium]
RLKQEQMNFSQDIFILVEQFNNQNKQLSIAIEADTIAGKRYRTSIETFMVGSINTLELNDAQMSKDVARRKWIDELYYYWYYYYQLRSITLWDFLQNESIDAEFDKIVNG